MSRPNPVIIDPRIGSIELRVLLESQPLPVEVATLPFGDYCFSGNGPRGACMVGIERKRIRDILSSMTDGRYTGFQLPGMLRHYDFSFLLIEGITRCSSEGVLEWPRGDNWEAVTLGARRFMHRDFHHFLTSIRLSSPIEVERTSTRHESAIFIAYLHHWFNHKLWSEHNSLHTFNRSGPVDVSLFPHSLCRRVAKELPGIDWVISERAALKFNDNTRDMVNATASEWQKINGIGPAISSRIVRAINGEEQDRRRI